MESVASIACKLAHRLRLLWFLAALPLAAAPDPNLFDGRISAPPAEPSGASGRPESGEGETTTEAPNSETGGGGETTTEAAGGGGETGETGGGGGSGSETGGSGSGDGSGGQEPRSFESFGFGVGGTEHKVEVNRSKDIGQSAPNMGRSTMPSSGLSEPSGAGNKAAGGSQATTGSTAGDYGTNLPSGL